MSLVHVSLFSGIGGFELAMAEAGIPTIAACEIDKAAQGVLADRFPGRGRIMTVTFHPHATGLVSPILRDLIAVRLDGRHVGILGPSLHGWILTTDGSDIGPWATEHEARHAITRILGAP